MISHTRLWVTSNDLVNIHWGIKSSSIIETLQTVLTSNLNIAFNIADEMTSPNKQIEITSTTQDLGKFINDSNIAKDKSKLLFSQ